MNVWVRYSVIGWVDSTAYKNEVAFRLEHLGPRHWSGISTNGEKRDITLHIDEELALLFALKYQNCRIDKEPVIA
jgi:hypothetical protein